MTKTEGNLNQFIVRIRNLIQSILVINLVSIAVWNLFGPTIKDFSDRLIDKFLNAVNSENIAGLIAEEDSRRLSNTRTKPPNGSTPE